MFVQMKPDRWEFAKCFLHRDVRQAKPGDLFEVALVWKRTDGIPGILYLVRNFTGAGISNASYYRLGQLYVNEKLLEEAIMFSDSRYRWFDDGYIIESGVTNRRMLTCLKRS